MRPLLVCHWSAGGIVKAHQHGGQVKLGHLTHYHGGQDTKALSLDKGKPPNGKIGEVVAG